MFADWKGVWIGNVSAWGDWEVTGDENKGLLCVCVCRELAAMSVIKEHKMEVCVQM